MACFKAHPKNKSAQPIPSAGGCENSQVKRTGRLMGGRPVAAAGCCSDSGGTIGNNSAFSKSLSVPGAGAPSIDFAPHHPNLGQPQTQRKYSPTPDCISGSIAVPSVIPSLKDFFIAAASLVQKTALPAAGACTGALPKRCRSQFGTNPDRHQH